MDFFESWGHFSVGQLLRPRWDWVPEVWRLITFQFLHANFWHLFLNMLGLFFFGKIVEDYLGRKRFLTFYLMCGVCGALLYCILLILGNVLPFDVPLVLIHDWYTPLIGASAGVFGILMAGAFIAPNLPVMLMFFPMRMKTMAYIIIGLALLNLFTRGQNAGGDAAHIGGALAGAYYIRHPYKLRDILEIFSRPFGGKRKSKRGPPSVGRAASRSDIDRILDKIRERGMDSLTEREKRTLQRSSRDMRS